MGFGSIFKCVVGAITGGAILGPVGSLIGGAAGLLGGGGSKGGGGILGQILGFGKMIQEQVESPIRSFIGKIKGGAWKGDDADAFVGEIERDLLPKVADLIAAIFGISTNIHKAVSNITDADTKSFRQHAQPSVDSFKF